MIFTPRLSNSGLALAIVPSSVVQTGVKSRGWEKSTPHESPSQSWKLISPSVVWAVKSGAVSPIVSAIGNPPIWRSAFDYIDALKRSQVASGAPAWEEWPRSTNSGRN